MDENDFSDFLGINGTFIRELIQQCEQDKANGKFMYEIGEGTRLATEFRVRFPNVSDTDLGIMMIIITKIVALIAEQDVLSLSSAVATIAGSYTYAAVDILKAPMDLSEL